MIAKGYALAAVPPALLYVWARGGRNELKRGTIAFVATVLVVAAPFMVTGPGGLRHAFRIQTGRGLHIESLGGSILAAADRLGLYSADVVSGFAFELDGSLPDAVATLATLVQLAALVAVWILFRRGTATEQRLVVAIGCRGRCLCRVREGPLAAVPDLAHPTRAARRRPRRRRGSCSPRSA